MIWALRILAILATVGFVMTFVVEAGLERRSQRVQLVRREAGRFATVGDPFDAIDVPPDAIAVRGLPGTAALADQAQFAAGRQLLTREAAMRTVWMARLGSSLAVLSVLIGIRGLARFQRHTPEVEI